MAVERALAAESSLEAAGAKPGPKEVRVLPDDSSVDWPLHADCHVRMWTEFREVLKAAGVPPEPAPTDEEETAPWPAGAARLELGSVPRRDTDEPIWRDAQFFEQHGEGVMDSIMFPREAQLKWDCLAAMHEQCRRLSLRNRGALAASRRRAADSRRAPDAASEDEGPSSASSERPAGGTPGTSPDMD